MNIVRKVMLFTVIGFFIGTGIVSGIGDNAVKNINNEYQINGESVYNRDETGQWVKNAGGSNYDHSEGIAVDSKGNIYITGYFYKNATFGDIVLKSRGHNDIFIAKLDANGVWQWARSAGGTLDDKGLDIAIDVNGNVYVTGKFQSTGFFGNIKLQALVEPNVFVAKLDTFGNWKWASNIRLKDISIRGIAVDTAGNAYITGDYFQDEGFGDNHHYDLFVAKLNDNGFQWMITPGDIWNDYAGDIAVDANDNVYITGCFNGFIKFGDTLLESTQGSFADVFIAKLNSDGGWEWAKRAGGTLDDFGTGITVDTAGNTFLIGDFESPSILFEKNSNNIEIINNGIRDVFIAKLNSDGRWQWAKGLGGISRDEGNGVAADTKGNTYVIGEFQGAAMFGDTNLTSNGNFDVFISKLDVNGIWQWTKQAGGVLKDVGTDIAVNAGEDICVTGDFEETMMFADTSITSYGDSDVFVAMLSAEEMNIPPMKPTTPDGLKEGKVDEKYTYTSSSFDENDDSLWFKWDWGNGQQSDWLGPYESGESCEGTHRWIEEGSYEVKVKAKDEHGGESDWSDPLSVSMPKTRQKNNQLLWMLYYYLDFIKLRFG